MGEEAHIVGRGGGEQSLEGGDVEWVKVCVGDEDIGGGFQVGEQVGGHKVVEDATVDDDVVLPENGDPGRAPVICCCAIGMAIGHGRRSGAVDGGHGEAASCPQLLGRVEK